MADRSQIIKNTARFVRKNLQDDPTSHDWWHIFRVWQNAKLIAKDTKVVNNFWIEMGALLHDSADFKFHKGKENEALAEVKSWLESQKVNAGDIDAILHIIKNVSFMGAGVDSQMQSQEGKIVQDADRLDAIGAIGIARAFGYGGKIGEAMYDPDLKPIQHKSAEEYKNRKSTIINHFYEKLLTLEEKMNTAEAKKIAHERHIFMERYLEQFFQEWDGRK